MKKNFVWINARLLPETEARISISNSAYLYGHGVFETLRASMGRVLFIRDHLQRFKKNARYLEIKLPYSQSFLKKEISRLLHKNKLREATIRVTLSEAPSGKAHLLITARPFIPYPRACYTKGGKLILIQSVHADAATIAGVKTTSYLTKILARKEIKKRHAVEGLLLNAAGSITEGASSNVFIIKRGVLYTPPLADALLPGIRRGIVIALSKRAGIPCQEKSLRPSDLYKADEVFITSTLKDILPIREFEGKKIGSSCPGPMTRRLAKIL